MDLYQIWHASVYYPQEGHRQVKPDLRGHARSQIQVEDLCLRYVNLNLRRQMTWEVGSDFIQSPFSKILHL